MESYTYNVKIYVAMFMFRFLFYSHEYNIGKVQIAMMRTLFEANNTRNLQEPSVTSIGIGNKQELYKGSVSKIHIHYKQCKNDKHVDFCLDLLITFM